MSPQPVLDMIMVPGGRILPSSVTISNIVSYFSAVTTNPTLVVREIEGRAPVAGRFRLDTFCIVVRNANRASAVFSLRFLIGPESRALRGPFCISERRRFLPPRRRAFVSDRSPSPPSRKIQGRLPEAQSISSNRRRDSKCILRRVANVQCHVPLFLF